MHSENKIAYFIGIGGIGMSALARYYNHLGYTVAGYDRTPTALTQALEAEGIAVHYNDDINLLPEALRAESVNKEALIIYTPAIPADHAEMNYLTGKGYTLQKRAQVLGAITRESYSIAVAGTHGKTTTSTLVAHIIKSAGEKVNAFLGGISANYNTNLLLAENAKYTVVEADEFDRSFLRLFPQVAIITSMDADHLDIYGDADEMVKCYNQFAAQVNGLLIYKYGLPVTNATGKTYTYGFDARADYHATGIKIENGYYRFNLVTPKGKISNVEVGLPGRHNVENAVAAFAATLSLGLNTDDIKQAIASYKGAKRRFEYIIKQPNLVFIDDYAHHPEELRACISSVKEMYPGKKVLGIFQPHLFSRTRDFADGFAESLDLLDEAVLLEIYPAREKPMEGVNATMLLDKMKLAHKALVAKEDLPAYVASKKADVVLTLGAGDIDKLIEPVKNKLLN